MGEASHSCIIFILLYFVGFGSYELILLHAVMLLFIYLFILSLQ